MGTINTLREVLPVVKPNYPVKVVVREQRDGGKRMRKELQGRRIKSNQEGYIYELSNGEQTQPVPYDAIDVQADGTQVVELYSPESGEYVPTGFDWDDEAITELMDERGAEAYRKNKYQQFRQFYQNKNLLERYQAPITIIMFAVAFILMSAGIVHYFEGLMVEQTSRLIEAANNAAG